MFHKIKNVTPLDDMMLIVEFMSGDKKEYDVKPLLYKWSAFKDLEKNNLFKYVKVDVGGYGVVWNEDIDLSCNELWDSGKIIASGATFRKDPR